ncbi:MAG: AMP-binding protein [Marinifilaceae bacterium]
MMYKITKNKEIVFSSKEDISNFQNEELKKLLIYLKEHSAFYQQQFKDNNIDINSINNTEDLLQFPTTSKDDFIGNESAFICVDNDELIDFVTTSGTSGEPVTFALTNNDLDRLAYNEYLSFTTASCSKKDKIQLMTTIDRRFMAGLAYFLGAKELGSGIIRVGNGIPELQWDTINRMHPSCCIVVPSFLLKLVEYAEKNNIDFNNSSLRSALCIGEPIRKNDFSLNTLGKKINDKWPNLKLYSTYASTEMQSSFTECEKSNGGHHQPELIIIEFLDDEGDRVDEDSLGELTITTLGVEGMPLLRFRTGDMCYHFNQKCECGRNTVRVGPVVGRKGQMIKFKGTSIYPTAFNDILDSIPNVTNYIIEVYTNNIGTDGVRIKVGSQDKSDEFSKEIKDIFRSKVRVAPDVVFEEVENINSLQMPATSRKRNKFIDLR